MSLNPAPGHVGANGPYEFFRFIDLLRAGETTGAEQLADAMNFRDQRELMLGVAAKLLDERNVDGPETEWECSHGYRLAGDVFRSCC
jgi:hypothetical protein